MLLALPRSASFDRYSRSRCCVKQREIADGHTISRTRWHDIAYWFDLPRATEYRRVCATPGASAIIPRPKLRIAGPELATATGSPPPLTAPCWVCGAPSNSREHKTKRSDLQAAFGRISQAAPLYLHSASRRNRRIGSLKADLLKSNAPFCHDCNTTLTQPYDLAWEILSNGLRHHPNLRPGGAIRINRIVSYDTRRCMVDAQLFFVKLFGCHVAENNIPIGLGSFARALRSRKAHPHVYLRFGVGPMLAGERVTGMSDMPLAMLPDGSCAFATWIYNIAGLSVNVMYAIPGEKRDGLVGSWHPKRGTTKVLIHDLS